MTVPLDSVRQWAGCFILNLINFFWIIPIQFYTFSLYHSYPSVKMNAVARLTKKLESKLAESNYYEAHQLYRTIYFRMQRDINYTALTDAAEEDHRMCPGHQNAVDDKKMELINNRLDFMDKNPAYAFLLDFLSTGVQTLLEFKELIAALDLIKLLLTQFNFVAIQYCPSTCPNVSQLGQWEKYFDFIGARLQDIFKALHAYSVCGNEMIVNKSVQSKGFVENDFINERDMLMERILLLSKNMRVRSLDKLEEKRMNASIRLFGIPEMHLQNGLVLVKNRELRKAVNCFIFSHNPFEVAKFLFFYADTEHNATEFELVLVKQLLRIFNVQMLIKAKPAEFRKVAQLIQPFRFGDISEEDMGLLRYKALDYVKRTFYYTLFVSKFFLMKKADSEGKKTTQLMEFKLLKFFNVYLLILEEFLRLSDVVPMRSHQNMWLNFVPQLIASFAFNGRRCFKTMAAAEAFIPYLAHNDALTQSLSDATLHLTKTDAKLYLLNLYHTLRTVVYKDLVNFYNRLDPEWGLEFMDRIFFIFFDGGVPNIPLIQQWAKVEPHTQGFFGVNVEEQTPRGGAGGGMAGMLMNLLGGASGSAQPGRSADDLNLDDCMDFLNGMMQ